jgi:DNA-binding NarL/FixJ family response regulator
MSPSKLPLPASVMIVEDDAITRRILSLAIESEPAFRLVATLSSVNAALIWLDHQPVDILLTDLGLPDGSGIEIIHACARRHPNCVIMVITISADAEDVFACIEAGALGYLLKGANRLEIVNAVLELRKGGAPMSPAIARMVLDRVRSGNKAPGVAQKDLTPQVTLTKREIDILNLVAQGCGFEEVARLISLSVGTVNSHFKNIYRKLSVHSRGSAVFEAQQRGLLQPERRKPKG